MKPTLLYAKIQLLRVFRDPVTLIVLFSIPLLLLLLFGGFTANDGSDIRLRVAVVNESDEQFAKTFAEQLNKVDVFEKPDEKLNRADAEQQLRENNLDGAIVLPDGFGETTGGLPSGKAQIIIDQNDRATGDIMMGVMGNIADETNNAITGTTPPIEIESSSVQGSDGSVFDGLYSMFTAMAIMMVGIFGVASTIPSDKKTGILRRMRVTPLSSSQMIGGLVIAYLVVTVMAVALMTIVAQMVFKMDMRGEWLDFSLFIFAAALLMIAIGVMVGGWAKNTTQSDIYGQIIFISSLAFSGLWVPRALMPDWMQAITAYLPLTPVIEGIQRIVTEGASLTALGFHLAVMAVWFTAVFIVSIKTFRWE